MTGQVRTTPVVWLGNGDGAAGAINDAVQRERRRIERNLHDGAQQSLVNASLMLGLAAKRLSDSGNEEIAALVRDGIDALNGSMSELRGLCRGLRPAALDHGGLIAAVEQLAARSAVPATVRASSLPRLDGPLEDAGYFIVAEALANAVKHADAQQLIVDIDCKDEALSVSVSDDGVGLANAHGVAAKHFGGTGLMGLHERAAAVGGQMRLQPSVGGGTTVSACFPLVGATPAPALPLAA